MGDQTDKHVQEEQVLLAAQHWHAATSRDDCDWEALTEWLEQDEAHQQAYADVALLDDRMAHHRSALQQSLQREMAPRRNTRWWPAAMAVSAVLALALALGWNHLPFSMPAAQSYRALADTASIALDDGTRILLAPGSQLRVGGRHQDQIELTGTAYFDVPHDPGRILRVTAGGYVVRDIGTQFELFGATHALKVAVAEGAVTVDLPGIADGARVVAGQRLLVVGAPPVAEYASIDAEDVGGWRSDRLVFRNEPLFLVAEQIGLRAGVAVTMDRSIAERRFSGVLVIGDGTQLLQRLAEIMGLAIQSQGDTVHLAVVGPGQ